MKNASHSNLFNLDTFEWQLPVKYSDSHSSQMHYIIYWQRGVYYGLFSRKLPLQFANTHKNMTKVSNMVLVIRAIL